MSSTSFKPLRLIAATLVAACGLLLSACGTMINSGNSSIPMRTQTLAQEQADENKDAVMTTEYVPTANGGQKVVVTKSPAQQRHETLNHGIDALVQENGDNRKAEAAAKVRPGFWAGVFGPSPGYNGYYGSSVGYPSSFGVTEQNPSSYQPRGTVLESGGGSPPSSSGTPTVTNPTSGQPRGGVRDAPGQGSPSSSGTITIPNPPSNIPRGYMVGG